MPRPYDTQNQAQLPNNYSNFFFLNERCSIHTWINYIAVINAVQKSSRNYSSYRKSETNRRAATAAASKPFPRSLLCNLKQHSSAVQHEAALVCCATRGSILLQCNMIQHSSAVKHEAAPPAVPHEATPPCSAIRGSTLLQCNMRQHSPTVKHEAALSCSAS